MLFISGRCTRRKQPKMPAQKYNHARVWTLFFSLIIFSFIYSFHNPFCTEARHYFGVNFRLFPSYSILTVKGIRCIRKPSQHDGVATRANLLR